MDTTKLYPRYWKIRTPYRIIRYDPNVLDPKSYCEIKLKCQFPTVMKKYSNWRNNRVLCEHMIHQPETGVLVGVKVAKLVAVDYDKSVDLESF